MSYLIPDTSACCIHVYIKCEFCWAFRIGYVLFCVGCGAGNEKLLIYWVLVLTGNEVLLNVILGGNGLKE